jgi:glycosyltransferase involved in cell wall biosynthesis
MERKKILCMTDSPKLHTGFSNVGKEIFTHLARTGKYEIKCIGWFHNETGEEVIYPIITTEKDDKGKITQEDKYAHRSFPAVVDSFKPDLVWTLGDMWMTDHVVSSPNRKTFKWIGYFPIDGHPSPSKWGPIVTNMDLAVAYGKYGMEVIKKRAPHANLRYIYHGVNTNTFHPLSYPERMEARKSIMGIGPEKIVLGIVARNQPRKAFDKLFEAYFYIINGFYVRCNSCKLVTTFYYDLVEKAIHPFDICKHCGSKDVVKGLARDDLRVYVHGAIADCGWDLLDLQNDFNLQGKVLVNPSLKIGVGVSQFTLNGVYNAFDIFTLPTRGEGFGLPILEAMSCGVPIVVTDYSAHPEWCRGAGELVPPAVLEAEPMTNIRRAVIDVDLYVTSLLRFIDDPAIRIACGKKGREIALGMDWKKICKEWESIIDGVIFPEGNVPNGFDPTQVTYELEAM